jgi:hypothetical protein
VSVGYGLDTSRFHFVAGRRRTVNSNHDHKKKKNDSENQGNKVFRPRFSIVKIMSLGSHLASLVSLKRRCSFSRGIVHHECFMPINVNPLWPTLFVVAGFLLAVRQAIGIRKTREFSSTSRLFLLVAASLFTVAGFTDVIARMVVLSR